MILPRLRNGRPLDLICLDRDHKINENNQLSSVSLDFSEICHIVELATNRVINQKLAEIRCISMKLPIERSRHSGSRMAQVAVVASVEKIDAEAE